MKHIRKTWLIATAIVCVAGLASGALYVNHELSQARQEAFIANQTEEALDPMLASADISALENATLVPNDDLQVYITSLFKNGESQTTADMQALLDVVSFWEDTNDDKEIIGSIYAKRPYAEKLAVLKTNRGWIESAYNEITGRTDILSAEDIHAYFDAGLTAEDILIANRLSLRGEITTAQALDRVQEGETWYAVITGVTPASDELESVSGHDILDAVNIARVRNVEVDAVLSGETDENITVETEQEIVSVEGGDVQ